MRIIENEIKELKDKMLDMAELVHRQLGYIKQAINEEDPEALDRVRKKEKKVNKLDLKIEKRCERIIALYQPVASDLRLVFSISKINAYLELIGDLTDGIARRMDRMEHPPSPETLRQLGLDTMLEKTHSILGMALESYFHERVEDSWALLPMDDEVDELNHAAFAKLTALIEAQPDCTADYLNLLVVVRNLEKIADFAVKIAQQAIFQSDGKFRKLRDLMKEQDRGADGSPKLNYGPGGASLAG